MQKTACIGTVSLCSYSENQKCHGFYCVGDLFQRSFWTLNKPYYNMLKYFFEISNSSFSHTSQKGDTKTWNTE